VITTAELTSSDFLLFILAGFIHVTSLWIVTRRVELTNRNNADVYEILAHDPVPLSVAFPEEASLIKLSEAVPPPEDLPI
jgi:hypothetical protein